MMIIEKLREHDYGSVAIGQDGERYYVVRKSAVETEWVKHRELSPNPNDWHDMSPVDTAISENTNTFLDACNVMFGRQTSSKAGVLLSVVDTLCENEFGIVARIAVLTGLGQQCDAYARKPLSSRVWLTIHCPAPSSCLRSFRAGIVTADEANRKEFLDKFSKAAGL